MSIKKNKKHLTLSGRIKIEASIEKGSNIASIAHSVPVNATTIYREIIRNRKSTKARNKRCANF